MSAHLRSLESPALADRTRRPGLNPREFINSDRNHADQTRPGYDWPSASMYVISRDEILVYHGLDSAVHYRHDTVAALDRPCDASFAETQDAFDNATDPRRYGNLFVRDHDNV